MNLKHHHFCILIVLIWYGILTGIGWRNSPTHVDEYYTAFIANGMDVSCYISEFTQGYVKGNPCSMSDRKLIDSGNTLANTIKSNLHDGGNSIVYYVLAHTVSKYLGPLIGVYNALKLLSCMVSLILILLLMNYFKHSIVPWTALIVGILFVSIAVSNNLFVRAYPLSALWVFIFILVFTGYDNSDQSKGINSIQRLNYLFICVLLPFIHFFNAFILVLAVLWSLYRLIYKKISVKRFLLLGLSPMAGILCLLIFYFNFNYAGSEFQKQLFSFWSMVSDNLLHPNYDNTLKFTLLNTIKVNARAGAFLFGLKFSEPVFNTLWYLVSIFFKLFLIIPVYAIYKLTMTRGNMNLLRFLIFIVLGYFIGLNFMAIFLKLNLPLQNSYVSCLFPVITILLGIFYENRSFIKPRLQLLLFLYLIFAFVNSILYSFRVTEFSSKASQYTDKDKLFISLNNQLLLLENR